MFTACHCIAYIQSQRSCTAPSYNSLYHFRPRFQNTPCLPMNTCPFPPFRIRVSTGILSRLALATLFSAGLTRAQTLTQEQQAAPGYTTPPPIIAIGGATVAAYSPPHEQLENPADDADDINDNNTFENLTRPVFLMPDLLTTAGNPTKPVATTDWWTHVLMNGDGGQLWQYPITAKFIASGIELQHILGPETTTTPGDYPTGFATGGLLRIEGVEISTASATPDIVLADFEGATSLPAGWTGTGSFGSSNPTTVQFVPPSGTTATFSGTAPTGYMGSQFLLTKNPGENSTGTITSAAFTANRSYLHFLMGGGLNAALRVEILDAATGTVLTSTQRTGASSAAMNWVRIDLTAYNSQSLKVRIVDSVASGWAWLAVDQFVLSNDGLAPPARPGSRLISGSPARVRDWSDWLVKVRKTDATVAGMTMDFTLVRNMPFVWLEVNNLNPRISFNTNAIVVLRDAAGTVLSGANLGAYEKLCIEVDGRFYGVHVAAGTTFAYDVGTKRLSATLPAGAGQNYLVVSALRAANQLNTFDGYAYARPEKTTVTYAYNPASATGGAVQTNWKYEVTALKAGATKVLQGWLPPHYRETGASLSLLPGLEYATPRGVLRCGEAVATTGFNINFAFNGILGNFSKPTLQGLPDGFDPAYMEQLLRSYDNTNDGRCDDTYYGAKNLVKHARAMNMAKELGLTDVYLNLKSELIASLTDWFTYDGTEQNHYFARNDRWGHIIGHNFVPDFNLAGFTDVHFHYGYYVLAYSLVAAEDPEFRDRFKDIAVHLARDYANWERTSTDYPWMRNFEPMVGHSYAGGSSSGGGNNQESSSESIQAWAGMFMLGEVLRGNDPRAADIMATAAFGYAIETRAVYEYYCDYHGSPFAANPRDLDGQPVTGTTRFGNWPDAFRYGKYAEGYADHPAWIFTNGIMGDGSNTFANYFSGEPAHTYGIQWLPNAPHMMFLAKDPAFIRGQFNTLFKYRAEHFAVANLNPLRSSMKNLRNKWYGAPTASNPDQRVVAIDEGWPTYGMKWAIQALYELNPAFVRDISHEGDPVRDNPLYDQATGTWLVTLPATDTKTSKITFPASIWTPDALIASNPQLVPPTTEAGLATYALAKWVAAFHTANGGPGPDWAKYKQYYSWDPANYPARDSAESINGLLSTMQDIGGNSWPLIALCYDGFAEPEFGLKVMAEYRRRNLSYATDTESNMFFYYYLTALQGLGTIQSDQHLSIGTSAVFKDAAGNRSYMVQNKANTYELVDVYQAGVKVGQVLAYPNTTTLQKGLLDTATGFAPIGTVPAKNSTGVSVNQDKIVVIFNEAFNPATLDTEVTISGPGGVSLVYQPGAVPQLAEYRVQGTWTLGATYTITVPGTVANAANTSTVGTARQFQFTIQSPFGLQITAATPAASATNVDPGLDTVELTFNSRLAPATLSGVTLTGAGAPTLTYDSTASTSSKAVFRIGSDLQPGGTYAITVPGTVADVYGQTLGTAQTFTFTTRQADSVLSTWPTTLNYSKYTVVASSGETTQIIAPGKLWNFDAIGDYVVLGIKAEKGGTYNLKATHRVDPNRAIARLLVNGAEVPNKLWNQSQTDPAAGFDFGSIRLEAGDNVLRFEVYQKNGTAQPKFSLIDTFFTPEDIDVELVPGPYAESGGTVVFEAEDYMKSNSITVGSVVRRWEFTTARPGFTGTGAMQSLPNNGVNLTTNLPTTSARLDYEVSFVTPGTYKVWIRGDAAGGDADDSVHIGLNGAVVSTSKDISMERATSFLWTTKRMSTTAPATLVIPSAGVYTINLWMREDGAYVDRILLTTDQAYVPAGSGPVASPRLLVPPTSTTASSSATTSSTSSTSSSGTSYAGVTTLTFAQAGVYDYLMVPDAGGEALSVEYLLLPGLQNGEYVSFDGTETFTTLPDLTTPYDIDGDGQEDYYDVFSFDQVLLPVPKASYNLAATVYTVSYQKKGSGFVYQFYSSTDAAGWTAADMTKETYNAATGFHQYKFLWNQSSGTPLFIRVQVSKP